MFPAYTFRSFNAADIPQLMALQEAYRLLYPGVPVIPGELYLSPSFHAGQNVFCAFSGEPGCERMVAYAPLYAQIVEDGPAHLYHRMWTEIKAHPGLAEPEPVKDALLARVLECARAAAAPFPGRSARVILEYRPHEEPAIAYALSRGFSYSETVFHMARSLADPIPDVPLPEGIVLRRWKMETEAEQQVYVDACNECFPETPTALAAWQYYLQSPQWAVGTMIAAFDGAELAGAVQAYWNPQDDPLVTGFTEDIFVRPAWRGRGIARAGIAGALHYLKEHGLHEAHLAVRALNANALGLYERLGYRTVQESRFYSLVL